MDNNNEVFNISFFMENSKLYETILVHTLKPIIYDSFRNIYDASKIEAKDPKIIAKNLSHLEVFQMYLITIKSWNNEVIEKHSKFIHDTCGFGNDFDYIIKATIKSKAIILSLSYNLDEKFHYDFIVNFNVTNFFHRCYLECSKECHNFANFFNDEGITPERYKINEYEIQKTLDLGIIRAIEKSIPLTQIATKFVNMKSIPKMYIQSQPENKNYPPVPNPFAQQQQAPQPINVPAIIQIPVDYDNLPRVENNKDVRAIKSNSEKRGIDKEIEKMQKLTENLRTSENGKKIPIDVKTDNPTFLPGVKKFIETNRFIEAYGTPKNPY